MRHLQALLVPLLVAVCSSQPGPFHNCCNNQTLRVAYPALDSHPWARYHVAADGTPYTTGFFPDLTKAVAVDMGFAVKEPTPHLLQAICWIANLSATQWHFRVGVRVVMR